MFKKGDAVVFKKDFYSEYTGKKVYIVDEFCIETRNLKTFVKLKDFNFYDIKNISTDMVELLTVARRRKINKIIKCL